MEDESLTPLEHGVSVLDHLRHNHSGGSRFSLGAYMRSDVLRKLELFRGCSHEFVTVVIDDVDIRFFTPGETILQEGDKAASCYILNRGEVSVQVDGEEVAQLQDGSIFGEICLLGLSQLRTASVIARSFCDVRVVHQDKFQYALKRFPKERHHFQDAAKRRMVELRTIADRKTPSSTSSQSEEPKRSLNVSHRSHSSGTACVRRPKAQPPYVDQKDETNPGRRQSHGVTQPVAPSRHQKLPVSSKRRPMPFLVEHVLKNIPQTSSGADYVAIHAESQPPALVSKKKRGHHLSLPPQRALEVPLDVVEQVAQSYSQTSNYAQSMLGELDPDLAELIITPPVNRLTKMLATSTVKSIRAESSMSTLSDDLNMSRDSSRCGYEGAPLGKNLQHILPIVSMVTPKRQMSEEASRDIILTHSLQGMQPPDYPINDAVKLINLCDSPVRRCSMGPQVSQDFTLKPSLKSIQPPDLGMADSPARRRSTASVAAALFAPRPPAAQPPHRQHVWVEN